MSVAEGEEQEEKFSGFGSLLGDVLSLVCAFLDARDGLLPMRHVSRHWSAVSRRPRSWSASHWEVDFSHLDSDYEWMNRDLVHITASLPHLRSLGLPFGFGGLFDLKNLGTMPLLERIVFRCHELGSEEEAKEANLLQRLPALRVIEVQDCDPDGNCSLEFIDSDVVALAPLKLERFSADKLNTHEFFTQMAGSAFGAHVRCINFTYMEFLDGPAAMAQYVSLVELHLGEDVSQRTARMGWQQRTRRLPSNGVLTLQQLT